MPDPRPGSTSLLPPESPGAPGRIPDTRGGPDTSYERIYHQARRQVPGTARSTRASHAGAHSRRTARLHSRPSHAGPPLSALRRPKSRLPSQSRPAVSRGTPSERRKTDQKIGTSRRPFAALRFLLRTAVTSRSGAALRGVPRSEEGLSGRNSVAPRVPIRAGISLLQRLVLEIPMNGFDGIQTQSPQWLDRPPCCRGSRGSLRGGSVDCQRTGRRRGLGDHEPSGGLQEGSRGLRDDSGPAERTGHHDLELGPEIRRPAGVLGPLLHHRDPIREPKPFQRPTKKGCTPAVGIEQRQPRLRPFAGDHETGQSPARAKVEYRRVSGHFRPGDTDETLRMPQLDVDRARA